MNKARGFLAVFVAGVVLLTWGGSSVYAQGAGTVEGKGNGLKIAPVRSDLTIEKGANRVVSLFVENITAFPITVRGVTNDFVPSNDESGEPRIILDEKESAPGNSFKTLVGKLPSVTLKPNERREIRVTLAVSENAASGGYYGAVRFVPGTGENDKNVALTASVGSIFLVRVPGDVTERMSVESFNVAKDGSVRSLFDSGPFTVQTRFRNLGNVHVQPFGKIFVKNMSGEIVDEIEINDAQPRGSVLPASVRKFEDSMKHQKYFGMYTIEGSFGYGTNGDLLLAKKRFFVLPYQLIATVIVVVAFLIFGLPRLLRAYNQRIINQANTARSKPRPGPRPKPKR